MASLENPLAEDPDMTGLNRANPCPEYATEAIMEGGSLAGVRILWPDGRTLQIGGDGGRTRELEAVADLRGADVLPVLIGSGLGEAIASILARGIPALAVVDREVDVLSLTGVRERYAADPRVLWLDQDDPELVVRDLTRWQMARGGLRFQVAVLPAYLRLNRALYHRVVHRLEPGQRVDFWSRARYPKFRTPKPRVLLLTSDYFLMGEVRAACARMDVPHRLLHIGSQETGRTEFVELLLQSVVEFRPDFVFTVNHLGVDREGVLVDLLERLELPLASWFVDNPHLILSLYQRLASPLTYIFTWDRDNVASLTVQGFPHVAYLPLGTDATRFDPERARSRTPAAWRARVSFVGNSMVTKVGARMRAGRFPRTLLEEYRSVAAGFAASGERSVDAYLAGVHPGLHQGYLGLDSIERRLAYETMLTWEATRQYRLDRVRQLMDFEPLIVGDRGWQILLRREARPWRWHPELNYYQDLPHFYPLSEVNFNCTSVQMKGAVNQRVFDVPASGAFVLTDDREQLGDLFEPGREVATYARPEEIPELVDRYLTHAGERRRIAQAARQRVLACHRYEHRLERVFAAMADCFA